MHDPVNIQRLEQLSSGDEDFLRELVESYLEDAPQQLEQLRKALDDQQREQAARAAHQIKGAASNVGADRLAELCQSIEQASQDAERMKQYQAEIEREFDRIRVYLDPFRSSSQAPGSAAGEPPDQAPA